VLLPLKLAPFTHIQTPQILPDANRERPSRVYPANDTDPALITELPVDGYQSRDLDDVAETLRITAVGHAQELLRQNHTSVPYVVVDVAGWVFSIRYTRCLQILHDGDITPGCKASSASPAVHLVSVT
jgi:hypothetical protein